MSRPGRRMGRSHLTRPTGTREGRVPTTRCRGYLRAALASALAGCLACLGLVAFLQTGVAEAAAKRVVRGDRLEEAVALDMADVPTVHWAYDALRQVLAAGLLNRYPDTQALRTGQPLSRYELALWTARALESAARQASSAEKMVGRQSLADSLLALRREFAPELEALGLTATVPAWLASPGTRKTDQAGTAPVRSAAGQPAAGHGAMQKAPLKPVAPAGSGGVASTWQDGTTASGWQAELQWQSWAPDPLAFGTPVGRADRLAGTEAGQRAADPSPSVTGRLSLLASTPGGPTLEAVYQLVDLDTLRSLTDTATHSVVGVTGALPVSNRAVLRAGVQVRPDPAGQGVGLATRAGGAAELRWGPGYQLAARYNLEAGATTAGHEAGVDLRVGLNKAAQLTASYRLVNFGPVERATLIEGQGTRKEQAVTGELKIRF